MATLTHTTSVAENARTVHDPALVAPVAGRNVAIDAYRGFVMLLMMAEVLQLSRVAAAYPVSLFWKILAFNQTHVEWFGCSLHDMEGFLDSTFRIHLGQTFFQFAGAGLEPFFRGAAILLCYWLVLFWMYRRKLFLTI